MKLILEIVNRSRFRAPPKRTIERALCAAADIGRHSYARERALVELVWVDSSEMRRLNSRFRGEKKATDVLSFEDGGIDPGADAVRLGEIVANLEEARRQAHLRGLAVCAEAALYAVHGLLHIFGMDDADASACAEMRRAESASFRRAHIRHPGVARVEDS